jgi:hypothetical protein
MRPKLIIQKIILWLCLVQLLVSIITHRESLEDFKTWYLIRQVVIKKKYMNETKFCCLALFLSLFAIIQCFPVRGQLMENRRFRDCDQVTHNGRRKLGLLESTWHVSSYKNNVWVLYYFPLSILPNIKEECYHLK